MTREKRKSTIAKNIFKSIESLKGSKNAFIVGWF
jgi:hypothetical protein